MRLLVSTNLVVSASSKYLIRNIPLARVVLSFDTRIKFLLGNIEFSVISKVIRSPSSLVLPSLGFYFIAHDFSINLFLPQTRASLGVY